METNCNSIVNRYPKQNSGHSNSFEVGNEFQDFVCIELAKQGIILQNINSKKFQFETGENLQGFEIKYDARCTGDNGTESTGRLSIEIAEKSNPEMPEFTKSGIFRDDNSWMYIQGNYMNFWIFPKKILRMLYNEYEKRNYKLKDNHPTVKAFYLPIADADRFCAKKFVFNMQTS